MNKKTFDTIEYKGQGTLSSWFIAKIDQKTYFLKTFRSSNACSVDTSKDVLKNEITILQKLIQAGVPTLYTGVVEWGDRLCVLYEYVSEGTSLKKYIDVIDSPANDQELPFWVQHNVRAKSPTTLSLEEIVEITKQISEQAKTYHNLEINEKQEGIILMDIGPHNILLDRSGRILKEARLIDFGIARKREEPIKQLFNEVIPDVVSGSYYGAGEDEPLHPKAYSPPNLKKDYGKKAEPSLDTYNLVNNLCLMLTGRLSEHWRDQIVGVDELNRLHNIKLTELQGKLGRRGIEKELESLLQEERSKAPVRTDRGLEYAANIYKSNYNYSISLDDDKSTAEKKAKEGFLKEAMIISTVETRILAETVKLWEDKYPFLQFEEDYIQLATIITKGTSPNKEERYQTTEELLEDLSKLKIGKPSAPKIEVPLLNFSIPPFVRDYQPKQPVPPLHELFEGDIQQARGKLEELAKEGAKNVYPYSTPLFTDNVNQQIAQAKEKAEKSKWSFRDYLYLGGILNCAILGAALVVGWTYKYVDWAPKAEVSLEQVQGQDNQITFECSDEGMNAGFKRIVLYENDEIVETFKTHEGKESLLRGSYEIGEKEPGEYTYILEVEDKGGQVVKSKPVKVESGENGVNPISSTGAVEKGTGNDMELAAFTALEKTIHIDSSRAAASVQFVPEADKPPDNYLPVVNESRRERRSSKKSLSKRGVTKRQQIDGIPYATLHASTLDKKVGEELTFELEARDYGINAGISRIVLYENDLPVQTWDGGKEHYKWNYNVTKNQGGTFVYQLEAIDKGKQVVKSDPVVVEFNVVLAPPPPATSGPPTIIYVQ